MVFIHFSDIFQFQISKLFITSAFAVRFTRAFLSITAFASATASFFFFVCHVFVNFCNYNPNSLIVFFATENYQIIGLSRPFYCNIALYVLNISNEIIFSFEVIPGSYFISKTLGISNFTKPTPLSFLSSSTIKGACPEHGI